MELDRMEKVRIIKKSNSSNRMGKGNAYHAQTKCKAKDLHGPTKPEQRNPQRVF